jgi:hypothetical protein
MLHDSQTTDAMAFPVEAVDGMDYEAIGGALDECGFVVQAGLTSRPHFADQTCRSHGKLSSGERARVIVRQAPSAHRPPLRISCGLRFLSVFLLESATQFHGSGRAR